MEAEQEHEETKLYNPDHKMKTFMDPYFKEFASAMFKQDVYSKCLLNNKKLTPKCLYESNYSNPSLPGTHINLKIL